jgi:hypothetical protein
MSECELDSLIVSEYPAVLEEFRGKRWVLLWRGSRDGDEAKEFHSRCDGHANTVTFVQDVRGNVFGGFTPQEWESRFPGTREKGDDSLPTFIFTLKNPSGSPPKKFALRLEKQNEAICCCPNSGPVFGGCCISVAHKGNETTNSNTGGFGITLTRRRIPHGRTKLQAQGGRGLRAQELNGCPRESRIFKAIVR